MENQTVSTVTVTEDTVIKSPIFLLFAEFLGYVSPVVEWAENMCNGKKLEEYQIKFIETDAKGIYDRILKDNFTKEDIKGWYNDLKDLLFSKYEESLNKNLNAQDDLPF